MHQIFMKLIRKYHRCDEFFINFPQKYTVTPLKTSKNNQISAIHFQSHSIFKFDQNSSAYLVIFKIPNTTRPKV